MSLNPRWDIALITFDVYLYHTVDTWYEQRLINTWIVSAQPPCFIWKGALANWLILIGGFSESEQVDWVPQLKETATLTIFARLEQIIYSLCWQKLLNPSCVYWWPVENVRTSLNVLGSAITFLCYAVAKTKRLRRLKNFQMSKIHIPAEQSNMSRKLAISKFLRLLLNNLTNREMNILNFGNNKQTYQQKTDCIRKILKLKTTSLSPNKKKMPIKFHSSYSHQMDPKWALRI